MQFSDSRLIHGSINMLPAIPFAVADCMPYWRHMMLSRLMVSWFGISRRTQVFRYSWPKYSYAYLHTQTYIHSRIDYAIHLRIIDRMNTAHEIVKEIAAHGWSDQAIADSCKCSQPTIWRIKNSEDYKCSSDLYISLNALRSSLEEASK